MNARPARRNRETGASQYRRSLGQLGRAWVQDHRRVALASLAKLLRQPLASVLTWLVIGIALALPAGFYVMLSNVESLGDLWGGSARISLYLEHSLSDADGQALAGRIGRQSQVASAQYVSAKDGLAEFRRFSGLGEVIDSLDSNPLPAAIVVTPESGYANPAAVEQLRKQLAGEPGVDVAELDMAWLQRLHALLAIGRRMAALLGVLLALGVVLVTGNTIRLAIESRREEIVVIKLVGGTNAYVRRPFLYTGLWYGFGGGLVAWLIIAAALAALAGPVAHLATLYESDYRLHGPGVMDTLGLLAAGMLLGLGGAALAVTRHLSAIEPR